MKIIIVRKKFLFLTVVMLVLMACTIMVAAGIFMKQAGAVSAEPSEERGAVQPDDEKKGGKLAIIIDDFGQNRDGVKEMMSINRHMTFAIMPFLTFSESDAETAHERGYEVIVHLPMEANTGRLSWVGPRPIMAGMTENEARHIVEDSFKSIPYASGANIHMGSKASGEEIIITGVMDVLKERGLYFVDSRTSDHPIGKRLAEASGVLCFERNVFLDEKRPKSGIIKQLRKAGDLALEKGEAIAVGHVGTEGGRVTAEAICEMLPEFDAENIKLVFVSELK